MVKLVLWMLLIVKIKAIELTNVTYSEETAGKIVFIKFFSTYCKWCEKMKPDWDELEEFYKDKDSIMIAEIDCGMDASREFCIEHKIESLPTLKYGDPDVLSDYEGSRDIESLKIFVELLSNFCSPSNMENCDEQSKKDIETYMKLSDEELESAIVREEELVNTVEKEFQKEVAELEKSYDILNNTKNDAITWVNKNTGLGGLRTIDDKKPPCSPTTPENCDEESKENIKKAKKMSAEELLAAIKQKEKVVAEAEKHFDQEVAKLQMQKTHGQFANKKARAIQNINNNGLSAMRIVARFRKSRNEIPKEKKEL